MRVTFIGLPVDFTQTERKVRKSLSRLTLIQEHLDGG